jgi:hypothetical protein
LKPHSRGFPTGTWGVKPALTVQEQDYLAMTASRAQRCHWPCCAEPEPDLQEPMEDIPLESPRSKKPLSKPSVVEILAKAGVRVKHKQEPEGLRTAPPKQQPALIAGRAWNASGTRERTR